MVAPVLVQMTVVHEPSLQLLQFATHLPPLLGKAPCFCALLFGELAMLGSSLCESRKAVLGPRTSGSPSMELTAAHRESGGTLAQGPATGPGLAPNTLPVWAVKPWFGIAFIVLNYHRFMGFYYTPFWMALLGMRDLVHGPRPSKTIQRN